MSIELKIDRDLTTRNVYLCTYESRKSSNGFASLWNVFGSNDNDGNSRWVNQGDSVVIRSEDIMPYPDYLKDSLKDLKDSLASR